MEVSRLFMYYVLKAFQKKTCMMDPEELLQGVIFQDLKKGKFKKANLLQYENRMEVSKTVLIFLSD
jgi:hypothetical protein